MILIDFEKLKGLVTIEDVLSVLRVELLPGRGRKRYGPCPIRCSVFYRAASFDTMRNCWFCHKCKNGGNHLELYSRATGINFYNACIDLCNRLNIQVPAVSRLNVPGM